MEAGKTTKVTLGVAATNDGRVAAKTSERAKEGGGSGRGGEEEGRGRKGEKGSLRCNRTGKLF